MRRDEIVGWKYYRAMNSDGKLACYVRISKTEIHECRKKKKYWIRTHGEFFFQKYEKILQIHNNRPLKELRKIKTLWGSREDRVFPGQIEKNEF